LVSQRDVLPFINKLISFAKTPVAVWDEHSHLLLGKADDVYDKQHPITLEGDVIGQVTGDDGAVLLASFLSFAALREYEKKALTRETLVKYRDLSHLYDISEKLSATFASDEIAQLAINETLSLFHATNASIMLTGGEKGLFQIIAASGTKNKQKTSLHKDKGIAGRVLKTGKAEVVNDVSSDPQFVKGGNNISSLMCAPLRTKDNIMGVFNVSSQESYTFSSEDLKLLTSIATQVGSALTNALLYEELNNYSEELRGKNIQLQTEIVERTLSAKALKESEEKYRLHFDNVMDVIYSVNPDLMITSISPSIEKLLGHKPEEVIVKPFPELNMLTPESLEKAFSDTKRILSGERIEAAEYQFIAKDGSIKLG
ncbi:MAG: GAF domain-containing protein, partial [Desulfobulbia bacterium]